MGDTIIVDHVHLILYNKDIIETFEALCSLPFIQSDGGEPPFKRERGIEHLIKQLQVYIDMEDNHE